MKKTITTALIFACTLVVQNAQAQENIHVEYLEWTEDGKIEEVKKYLAKGADVNYKNERGYGAGEYAIWNMDEDGGELINFLLDKGLKTDYRNRDGEGLLHIAAENEGSAIFKRLVDSGIPIDGLTDDGETALLIAAQSEDYNAVKMLISLGANVQLANEEGESIINSYDLEKEALWNDLMSFNLSKEQLNYLLFESVYELESPDKVKQLIQKGANVNIKNEDDFPLIHLAAQTESPEILSMLIANGANVNDTDEDGYNPLWEAETIEMMTILIEKGADLNQVVDDEPLIAQSIYFGAMDEVQLLVSKGANLQLKNDGESLLTYAKSLLNLEHRPGIRYKEESQQAIADEAYKNQVKEIINYLKSKGAK